ncbi:hypothetical protein [Pseudomonas chlororaphis]|uniref:hypothetical protein n=1 Tax=Pseudomonas chlororaphis TaxID=587753 RepID=UPI000F765F3F|nr:hypothetical protein [Pseudomonas chlororaphis]MBM0283422.1 hypothetical protein [Pseudomonas chlororaphis]MDO1503749.1 hypothetical protein [Pseudomonas chlororaphis]TWR95088.1 hypothetical protein FJD36_18790 [Pseudomonas chlororaphis subsp. chlororaphis]WDG99076.1 hypothetical protein PUP54_05775 [Pseudomonas chlororaphis]WDH18083.1 hypothetical protein PUP70_08275 [Pseudomonas chlororaphis]
MTEICKCKRQDSLSVFFQNYIGHFVTLLAVVITVIGGFLTFNHQWEMNRHDRLVSDAHKVSDELTVLLFNDLKYLKVLNDSISKGEDWERFVQGPYAEYLTRKEVWRRDVIIMHYKVERYFGSDIANDLINTEKLISGASYEDLSSPSPCATPADAERSLMVTSDVIECQIRMAAYLKMKLSKDSDDVFGDITRDINLSRNNAENMRLYDRGIVSYIRAINSRLTSLGEVSVQPLIDN